MNRLSRGRRTRARFRNATSGRSDRRVASPRAGLAIAVLAVLGLAPQLAAACPVCSAGQEEATRMAFILTTVFLTALPLSVVGSIVWWLQRRMRAHERTPAGEHRDADAPAQALRA